MSVIGVRRDRVSGLFLLAAWCVVASASSGFAQVAAGEITGLVKDQAGAAVPGATVTVTNVDTNRQRVVVSSGEGVYAAPSLAPGDYRVDVDLPGFKPVRQTGIRLSTGEKARIDFDLAVGEVRELVTVTADASILRAETASLGTVIEHEQVVQLPLNGRTFILLAALAPGVALPPGTQLPRINGGRPRTNEYLFDGISVLQPEPGQVAYFPVIDAIQEFKIESNSAPAEFGRFNGGVINLTTKAGSNVVHGSGFEFFRNDSLNARNYFQSAIPVKPDYQRNQFGGTLGGPLATDHTFFFVDYQGQRQAIGRTVTSVVPTLLQRQGIFTEAIAGRVPVDLRSRLGRRGADSFSRKHDPHRPHGPRGAVAPAALSVANGRWNGEQLQPDCERDRRPGPVGRADRPPLSGQSRCRVRPPDVLSRRFRAGDAASGWQRRDQRNPRPAEHDGLVLCVELSAHVLEQRAERAANR